MGLISRPNSYTANTTIVASEVNDDFNTIYNEFNGGIGAANLATDAVTEAKLADGTVTTAKLADTSVTNAKLETGAGEPGGAWDDWTPTLVNLSGGTITYAKYKKVGRTVNIRFKYTLAGAGVAGDVTMTLPVTAAAYGAGDICAGATHHLDANGNDRVGLCRFNSTTVVNILTCNTSGTPIALSSTEPFTWASGDNITVGFTYESET